MAKNIVICSDGTGNTTIKGRGTNVFKLFEAVDLNGHRANPNLTPQVALYDDGVGTQNLTPLKILGGAAGFGLARNVRQLYKELCRIYDPGDRIFVFGFSRGAFTVRSLVGFISVCGLVDPSRAPEKRDLDRLVRKAYRAYRNCYWSWWAYLLGLIDKEAPAKFRAEFGRQEKTRIAFMGVWDTVDAVGLPLRLSDLLNLVVYRFKFPDLKLGACVDRACHALAIDDERKSFHPLVWDETEENKEKPRIEQVWFAGAHSNVGGGYPKQGMSLVALEWMMEQAARKAGDEEGLRFNRSDREIVEAHASVDDKLYDPRSGLGTFYPWQPRDIATICEKSGVVPCLHVSVLERIAHATEDYAPANLPPGTRITYTRTGDPARDAALDLRASHLQDAYTKAVATASVLSQVKVWIGLGRLSHALLIVTCLAFLYFFPEVALKGVGWEAIAGPTPPDSSVLDRLLESWRVVVGLTAGGLLSSVLSRWAGRRIDRKAWALWFKAHPHLRNALKAARNEAPSVPVS